VPVLDARMVLVINDGVMVGMVVRVVEVERSLRAEMVGVDREGEGRKYDDMHTGGLVNIPLAASF